jgi:tetratricopeptide (TPR) repeat protein
LVGVHGVLVAGFLVLALYGGDRGPPVLERYPELAGVDDALLFALRGRPPARGDAAGRRLAPVWGDSIGDWRRKAEAVGLLDRNPAAAAKAVLRLVVEDGTPVPGPGPSTAICTIRHSACRDPACLPLAVWLSRGAGPFEEAILRRMLVDRGLTHEARGFAVVALCRRGNASALPLLAAVAADPAEDNLLRRAVLLRLARIAAPPPPGLRDLLYLPPPRNEPLDRLAAAALAVLGDPEAPTLVREGLRSLRFGCMGDWCLMLDAAIAIARGDARVAEAAEPLRCRNVDQEWVTVVKGAPDPKDLLRRAAEAFETWLADHPEAADTEFERGEREYLASDRRRRELSIDSFEAVRDAPEENLDFAAGAVVVDERYAPGREAVLTALDRLARLLRARIGGDRDPERIVAVLNRALLPPPGSTVHIVSDGRHGPISGLAAALDGYWANCLGRTSLYLAVAERLGLPFRAVAVPGHIRVRWEEPGRRFDVELTADGAIVEPDADPRSAGPPAPAAGGGASGPRFRVLTRGEALARVCVNLGQEAAPFSPEPEPAHTLAMMNRALELDPRCAEALVIRAVRTAKLAPSRVDEALEDCARALEIEPRFLAARCAAGAVCCTAGDHRRALEHYAGAIAMEPSDPSGYAGRADCLLRHRKRPDLALGEIDAAPEAVRPALELRRLEALVRLGDPRYRDALPAPAPDSWWVPEPWRLVAELVADGAWPAESSPSEAAWILSRLRGVPEFEELRRRDPAPDVLRRLEALAGRR